MLNNHRSQKLCVPASFDLNMNTCDISQSFFIIWNQVKMKENSDFHFMPEFTV